MRKMDINIRLENPCVERKNFCINCHSQFMAVRPLIKGVVVSKHFVRDLKDAEKINSIINSILDCSRLEFNELHKFEESVNGNLIFRARKENLHIVYCVDKKMKMIFLRAIRNFDEYKKFLEDTKEVRKMIEKLSALNS
jgi:mRNA-degrading endonuclease RelE of RelBE toxin-antitoxin system